MTALVSLCAGSTHAQCNPSASITGPSSVGPFTETTFVAQLSQCDGTAQVSYDGGQTYTGIAASGNTFSFKIRSTGCESTILLRLSCSYTCQGQTFNFNTNPVSVSWDRYVPQFRLEADDNGAFAPYDVRAQLLNPAPLLPEAFVTFQYRDNGGDWIQPFGTNVGGTLRKITTLSSAGCATGREHRMLYSNCNITTVSPVATISWPQYLPQFELQADNNGTFAPYAVRARLLNPRPLAPAVFATFRYRDNGGNWVQPFGTNIDGTLRTITTLNSTGCATTREHQLFYNACDSQTLSPLASISWPQYVPEFQLESEQNGPHAPYAVQARLMNPRPLAPAAFATFRYRDNGGKWVQPFGTNIDGTLRTITTLNSTGCATTREHQLFYNACDSQTLSPINIASWAKYVPIVSMNVSGSFPLGPAQPYSITSKLLNPRPLLQSVNNLTLEYSDDSGAHFSNFGGFYSAGPQEAVVFNGVTTRCETTRIHRFRYDSCNEFAIVGSTNATWLGTPAAPGVIAPPSISPGQSYQVFASVSGVQGNLGTLRYSDDGGATWVTVSGFVNSQTFTLNAGQCRGARIHSVTALDFCGNTVGDTDTSCCTGSGGPGAIAAPASQPLVVGSTTVFSASPINDDPADVAYQWRRNGVPLVNGANPGMGGIVAGAQASTLLITNTSGLDRGRFDCLVTSVCGTSTSNPAELVGCAADFNSDGFADGFDYDDFIACFEGDPCPPGQTADFNGDGFADGFDFDDFVEAFESGCP